MKTQNTLIGIQEKYIETINAVKQMFVAPKRIGELRKEAKKQGWGRIAGADYCPSCMEAI